MTLNRTVPNYLLIAIEENRMRTRQTDDGGCLE
jgi:hypothetical protein